MRESTRFYRRTPNVWSGSVLAEAIVDGSVPVAIPWSTGIPVSVSIVVVTVPITVTVAVPRVSGTSKTGLAIVGVRTLTVPGLPARTRGLFFDIEWGLYCFLRDGIWPRVASGSRSGRGLDADLIYGLRERWHVLRDGRDRLHVRVSCAGNMGHHSWSRRDGRDLVGVVHGLFNVCSRVRSRVRLGWLRHDFSLFRSSRTQIHAGEDGWLRDCAVKVVLAVLY